MRTLVHPAVKGAGGLAIALLSGTYSEPEDFVREGFHSAVRDEGIEAEVIMAELRAAWFADATVVARIREHVVLPARRRGHARIWLAGISLGALAALCYAARHESDIEGIVLISPYPATREVLREMQEAGGVGRWRPEIPAEGDLEREAWLWLADRGGRRPQVHCYFGSADRFASGQRLMADALDPGHVREMPGGHDWDAWRMLWREFLSRSRAELL